MTMQATPSPAAYRSAVHTLPAMREAMMGRHGPQIPIDSLSRAIGTQGAQTRSVIALDGLGTPSTLRASYDFGRRQGAFRMLGENAPRVFLGVIARPACRGGDHPTLSGCALHQGGDMRREFSFGNVAGQIHLHDNLQPSGFDRQTLTDGCAPCQYHWLINFGRPN